MVKVTNLIKAATLVLSVLAAMPALSKASKEEAIQKILPQLENKIVATMKAAGIPGVAVAIVSSDKVYYIKGFGVKKIGKTDKITPATLFQIASLSKPVNATMLAVLQDKGKLSFDDSVARYLPSFRLRTQKQPLKICHIVSHSTGVPNSGFEDQIGKFAPRENIIRRLQKTYPVAQPGKRFIYHNAMYGVLEDIIVKASGKPYERALQEDLFKPLGMKSACTGLKALMNAPDKAYPHVPNYRGRYVPAEKYSSGYYAFRAAGGVNASIQDMSAFLQVYLGKSSHIVSRKSLHEVTSPFVKNPKAVITSEVRKGLITNTFYGYGWQSMNYGNQKIIYHQGHLKGFRNFMGYLPNDVGIVILTNADRKHASKIALKFFELYLNA